MAQDAEKQPRYMGVLPSNQLMTIDDWLEAIYSLHMLMWHDRPCDNWFYEGISQDEQREKIQKMADEWDEDKSPIAIGMGGLLTKEQPYQNLDHIPTMRSTMENVFNRKSKLSLLELFKGYFDQCGKDIVFDGANVFIDEKPALNTYKDDGGDADGFIFIDLFRHVLDNPLNFFQSLSETAQTETQDNLLQSAGFLETLLAEGLSKYETLLNIKLLPEYPRSLSSRFRTTLDRMTPPPPESVYQRDLFGQLEYLSGQLDKHGQTDSEQHPIVQMKLDQPCRALDDWDVLQASYELFRLMFTARLYECLAKEKLDYEGSIPASFHRELFPSERNKLEFTEAIVLLNMAYQGGSYKAEEALSLIFPIGQSKDEQKATLKRLAGGRVLTPPNLKLPKASNDELEGLLSALHIAYRNYPDTHCLTLIWLPLLSQMETQGQLSSLTVSWDFWDFCITKFLAKNEPLVEAVNSSEPVQLGQAEGENREQDCPYDLSGFTTIEQKERFLFVWKQKPTLNDIQTKFKIDRQAWNKSKDTLNLKLRDCEIRFKNNRYEVTALSVE